MALDIFADDPDAKPAPKVERTFENPDFHFRSGMSVWNPAKKKNEGVSLEAWRVLTDEPATARAISQLMGGQPDEFAPDKPLNLQVLTTTSSVEIVLDSAEAIEDKLILWGPRGPIHECTGREFLSPPERKGEPCGCPKTIKERKAAASAGTGPAPAINVNFRLAHDYDLGRGKLIITAWTAAMTIHEVKEALDDVDGPALCSLTLEVVEFVSKVHGPVRYVKPVIKVLGSYNDAIADDPDLDA